MENDKKLAYASDDYEEENKLICISPKKDYLKNHHTISNGCDSPSMQEDLLTRDNMRLKRKVEVENNNITSKVLSNNKKNHIDSLNAELLAIKERLALYESEVGLPKAGVSVFLNEETIADLFPTLASIDKESLPFNVYKNGSLENKTCGIQQELVWNELINVLQEDPAKRQFLNVLIKTKD